MSVKDMIKKSVLESGAFTNYDVPGILTALAAALLLGALIYLVYRKFYAGVVFSRTFAVTLVGMTVLTCMVTLAISTNVVISLGMVGALSISVQQLRILWIFCICSGQSPQELRLERECMSWRFWRLQL